MASISDDKSFTVPTEAELVAAFQKADADGGGDIDFDEFVEMVSSFGDALEGAGGGGKKSGGLFGGIASGFGKKKRKEEKRRKALRAVFEAMDEDGGGSIDFDEFRHAMKAMAANGTTPPPPEEELRKAFDDVDRDGGGSVDFDEFVEMIDSIQSAEASTGGNAQMNSLFVQAAARIGREQKEKAKLRDIFEGKQPINSYI
jgi:Ca2+-binding EF-hand superfamily protein